jgi:hypothetical protein
VQFPWAVSRPPLDDFPSLGVSRTNKDFSNFVKTQAQQRINGELHPYCFYNVSRACVLAYLEEVDYFGKENPEG